MLMLFPPFSAVCGHPGLALLLLLLVPLLLAVAALPVLHLHLRRQQLLHCACRHACDLVCLLLAAAVTLVCRQGTLLLLLAIWFWRLGTWQLWLLET
jgi:hypothetical protein